jgi:hypothetical protein
VEDQSMQLDQLTVQVFLDVMAIPGAAMMVSFCYLFKRANRQSIAANRASQPAPDRLVQKFEM